MLNFYLPCSALAMMLLIWFKTEAFVEYCRVLKLDRFYKDYDIKKEGDARLTYLMYLRRYHDSFFIRLITCPICLSIWLSGGLAIVTWNPIVLPSVMIGGLFIYGVIDRLLG